MANLPGCSDYSAAIANPKLIKDPILSNGKPIEKNGRQIKYTGGFCIVFPFETPTKKYAVRFWHANVPEIKDRTRIISEALNTVNLPYFVEFDYIEDGIATSLGLQPLVRMDWVEAKSLKSYIASKLNDTNVLNKLAEDFKKMVQDLHKHSFSHGDLQHGNIMVRDNGALVLVDYDSMYVPKLLGRTDEIKGLQGYQHESRWTNKDLSPKADYFSELVIYLSIIAIANKPSLWSELNIDNTDTLLFSSEDIKSKGTAPIFKDLKDEMATKELTVKLIEFMNRTSIEELEPLENIVVTFIDRLSDKWADNGFRKKTEQEKQIEIKKAAENIAQKFS